jgi:hypothetical protein
MTDNVLENYIEKTVEELSDSIINSQKLIHYCDKDIKSEYDSNIKDSFVFSKLTNKNIKINGKCNNVIITNCSSSVLYFDDIISNIIVINCNNIIISTLDLKFSEIEYSDNIKLNTTNIDTIIILRHSNNITYNNALTRATPFTNLVMSEKDIIYLDDVILNDLTIGIIKSCDI